MLIDFADPFLGNDASQLPPPQGLAANWFFLKAQTGNTHPGAAWPLGLMTAAPYTGGYPNGTGPYAANSCGRPRAIMDPEHKTVMGVSHLHHSGTGAIRQYENYVIVTPVHGPATARYARQPLTDQAARPGFYSSRIGQTQVALTVTPRAALHQYRFAHESGNQLIADLRLNGLVQAGVPEEPLAIVNKVSLLPDGLKARISGQLPMEIALVCPQAESVQPLGDGRFLIVVRGRDATLAVSISFSLRDRALGHARSALEAGFAACRESAGLAWEAMLSRMELDASREDKIKLYSALYHGLLKPMDCSGDAPFWNDRPCLIDYATLWDQQKTQLPLLLTLFPDLGRRMVASFTASFEQFGFFPNAFLLQEPDSAHDMQARALTVCTLLDAFVRGVDADWPHVLACIAGELDRDDNRAFFGGGRVSAYPSHTIDLAVACHAARLLAVELGQDKLAGRLRQAEDLWLNEYDPRTGLLRADGQYYEGTHWNYSFRLLPDMEGRMRLSPDFVGQLDTFFGYRRGPVRQLSAPVTVDEVRRGEQHYSFEGLNNETDMEAPYAYIYAGRRDRTAKILRDATRSCFGHGRGGLCGNDDSGGLSSCLIWNMLGLFPVSGQNRILFGNPAVAGARLHLASGKVLDLKADGLSDEAFFARSVNWNGQVAGDWIGADQLMAGGQVRFLMGPLPDPTRPGR